MIKNFNIKLLPVFITLIIVMYIPEAKAVEKESKYYAAEKKEIVSKKQKNVYGGFLKRFFKKTAEKISEIKRKISKKIKRKISKRKARKNRTKAPLKERNKNLFNILIFSSLFLIITGAILFLFLYGIINYTLFLILSLIFGITAIVTALIYFSNRYIIKPNYK